MVNKRNNSALYGILAGLALIIFYLAVVSIFQGIELAFLSLRSLWFWIFPLAIGFGTQVGLYASIKHTAQMTGTVAGSGAISGGSMIACCSHYVLNLIPIVGMSALAGFLIVYQEWFLGFGIIANIFGIVFLLNHKKKMKGGKC